MQFIMFKSNKVIKQAYNMVISQIVLILYLSENAFVMSQEVFALFTYYQIKHDAFKSWSNLRSYSWQIMTSPLLCFGKKKPIFLIKDMRSICFSAKYDLYEIIS